MLSKNKIAISVAVGILGVAGVMTSAQAVHVNPDGTGQVLLFPYYNARDGYVTNINIVNSTDQTKAVKIRFREGKNSQDVLDFNIYMSPEDVWTGSVQPGVGIDGKSKVAAISTSDRSCTLPILVDCKVGECVSKPQPFTGIGVAPDDTREGYVEVIEMGVVTDKTVADGVLHTNGTPNNCKVLEAAWQYQDKSPLGILDKNDVPVGIFAKGAGSADAEGISAPTGGLFGSSAIINIGEGSAFAVDPIAIDNYSTAPQHHRADHTEQYLLPSLASGNVTTSSVMIHNAGGTQLVQTTWDTTAKDTCQDASGIPCGINPYPIAHVLLAPHLMNEYFLDPAFGYDGHTDWVVSFPMKKHGIHAGAQDITATFENGIFDREEGRPAAVAGGDLDFGFSPPAGGGIDAVDQTSKLLREVNVLSFKSTAQSEAALSRTVMSSLEAQHISVGPFVYGWARLSFPGYDLSAGNPQGKGYGVTPANYTAGSNIYKGVPAVGAAFIEGNVSQNANARFGDALPHKIQRD
ncbi:hypothetical protein [Candidatus Thiothrix anitrata]|uniref:Uncharacterized protein n=1 Tax=Candidatus Thiothrix anitrata TaxID=2823902 RepID=A0ABX7X8G1_9GAMM|nr:hypothetical protein [Candidatus Thiothrix anitrata]QTR51526.1 hypothetical protein J8380_08310 [Candidatus Thiothrix anitrata]